jgi:hypothetical protein
LAGAVSNLRRFETIGDQRAMFFGVVHVVTTFAIGVKRTWLFAPHRSAFDQKRTFQFDAKSVASVFSAVAQRDYLQG